MWNFYFSFKGEPHLSGGGPAYKPQEDYYDEIIELKKVSSNKGVGNLFLFTQ